MSTDAIQEPWNRAALEIGNESTFDSREHAIMVACKKYAAALTQENQRLRAQIESLDFGPPVSESDINEMAEERNRMRDELQSARREIEELKTTIRQLKYDKDKLYAKLNAATPAKP